MVEAHAAGKIKLPQAGAIRGTARYAPSFKVDGLVSARAETALPYTAATVAEFLKWKEWKVEAALAALATI